MLEIGDAALANRTYDEEAARLAKLHRSKRFEELIRFPTRHMFKVIGRRGTFEDAIREVLVSLGHKDVIVVERYSAQGNHVSLTFELAVESAEKLDTVYSVLERVEGVSYLL